MSESSLSDSRPDDAVLEQELRQIVRQIYKAGNLEELTVKRVRTAAEKNLGLEDGFFKESQWKVKSKAIIEAEATAHGDGASSKAESSPAKPSPSPPKAPAKAQKRSSPSDSKPRKRQKVSKKAVSDEEEESMSDQETPRKSLKKARGKATIVDQSFSSDLLDAVESGEVAASKRRPDQDAGSLKPKLLVGAQKLSSMTNADGIPEGELSEVLDEDLELKRNDAESGPKKPKQDEASESELSEPIDDEPKPKRKKRGSGSNEPKSKGAPKKSRQKKDKSPDLDPDAEEIKRLQSWLIKCGIRKMWGRELKPYETPKAKIRHLREMLSNAGMTGRFSVEKASQIREARELQADLEAVQEGARNWGKSDEEEEEEQPQRRRRLAKGLEGLDFLNDDDGEETD